MRPPLPPQFGMVGARREHLERLRGYGFRRVEAVLVPPEDREWLRGYFAEMPGGFSFHCPAFREDGYPEYPLKAALVDPSATRRRQALQLMERELEQAAQWGARFLVVHLQRNLMMDQELPPAHWGEAEGLDLALEAVGELLHLSRRTGVPVHLENMMGSPLFYRPETYRALAEALPEARYCLDVGHAALDARHFGFAERELAEAMGPGLASVHLYDNHLPPVIDFPHLRESGLLRKHPVHPEHQGRDGWIDAAGCLRAALSAQPEALITFEVYYRLDVDHAHTAQGIDWVVALAAGLAASPSGASAGPPPLPSE